MAGLGDALAYALGGYINGQTQRRAVNYAHDDQVAAEQDAFRRSAPARYDALTRTPQFALLTPQQQTAIGEQFQTQGGSLYGNRITPVGSVIGSTTRMESTGNFLQGPPSPADSAAMQAAGIDRPSGGYPEMVQARDQITMPAFTPYVAPPKLLAPSEIARNEAQAAQAQAQTAQTKQNTALAPVTALEAYTKTLPGLSDSLYGQPLAQERAGIEGYNKGGANLPGFTPALLPGDPTGDARFVPRGPNLPGPPTAAQELGFLGNDQPAYGFDKAPPKVFGQTAGLQLSPEKQKEIADQAAAEAKAKQDALFKTADQKITMRGQDLTAGTARTGQALTARGQDLTARTAAAGQAVTLAGQQSTAQTAANRLDYDMTKPDTAGQVTPAQMFTQAHSDRVRQQAQVDKLAGLRDAAIKKLRAAENALATGIDPEAEPARDKKTGALLNPAEANGVPLTEGRKALLRQVFQNADDDSSRYQAQIDAIKKGMPQAAPIPGANGADRHPSSGQFISPQAKPKPGKRTAYINNQPYTVEEVA